MSTASPPLAEPTAVAPEDSRRAARILGVGHIAVDLVFEVDQIPTQPVKTPARRHRQGVGGMTANACVAAARLGAQVDFISPVGDDAYAAVFERHLKAEGLDTAGLIRVPGHGSSVSSILVDAQGERLIVNCRGSALNEAPPWDQVPVLRQALQHIAARDVLLTDPRCMAWARQALLAARQAGVCSVLDGDTTPVQDLRALVGLAHWAVFSWTGLSGLQGLPGPTGGAPQEATLRAGLALALGLGARGAAVTLGEHGVLWQDATGAEGFVPAFRPGQVVDTVGAGDVFHGAFAVALAEAQDAPQALRFASAAAALKCCQPGGVLGAPSRSQVQAFLLAQG